MFVGHTNELKFRFAIRCSVTEDCFLLLVQILFPESDEAGCRNRLRISRYWGGPEKALVLLFQAKAYHVIDAGLRWCSKDNERERVPVRFSAAKTNSFEQWGVSPTKVRKVPQKSS